MQLLAVCGHADSFHFSTIACAMANDDFCTKLLTRWEYFCIQFKYISGHQITDFSEAQPPYGMFYVPISLIPYRLGRQGAEGEGTNVSFWEIFSNFGS